MAQQYSEEWEPEDDLVYYKTILEASGNEIEKEQHEEAENTCDCLEEYIGLHFNLIFFNKTKFSLKF